MLFSALNGVLPDAAVQVLRDGAVSPMLISHTRADGLPSAGLSNWLCDVEGVFRVGGLCCCTLAVVINQNSC